MEYVLDTPYGYQREWNSTTEERITDAFDIDKYDNNQKKIQIDVITTKIKIEMAVYHDIAKTT